VYDINQGTALALRSESLFKPASSDREATPQSQDDENWKVIRLPLGPDDARPFEDPEYWAGYTFTGA